MMLHVEIGRSNENIIILHGYIIYHACKGQKYSVCNAPYTLNDDLDFYKYIFTCLYKCTPPQLFGG